MCTADFVGFVLSDAMPILAGAAAIGAAAVYIYKSGETPEEIVEVRPFTRFTHFSATYTPDLRTSVRVSVPWLS